MKNILVLIDLKREPEHILRSALKIARQLQANLVLANLHPALSVVEELHYSYGYSTEESYSTIEELADHLKEKCLTSNEFNPIIECSDLKNTDPSVLKEFVVKNNIWMVIEYLPLPVEFDIKSVEDSIINIVNHTNCPRLFLPVDTSFNQIDKIAYFTDLRYCDLGVVRFLKSFNAFLFITHVTTRGLPDIHHQYAQDIVSDEITAKSGYKKVFLRNINRAGHIGEIGKVIETDGIKMCAIVSKKHGLLEELLPIKSAGVKHLYRLPLLILPFLNWFICKV
jgi:hypothetical protein